MTIQKAHFIFLTQFLKGTVKEKTYKSYNICLNLLEKEYRTDLTLENYTKQDLQKAVNELCYKCYSKSTLLKCKYLTIRLFRELLENSVISMQLKSVKIPNIAKVQKVNALTETEIVDFENYCKDNIIYEPLLILFDTGLRLSEYRQVKKSDIKNGVLFVENSKTDNGIRQIPLTDRAKKLLSKNKNLKVSEKKIYRLCKEISGDLDFRVRPHILRHTFATTLINNGANVKEVSVLLGHSSVAFTLQRYVSVDITELKKNIDILNNL